jgi:hypothetical protein
MGQAEGREEGFDIDRDTRDSEELEREDGMDTDLNQGEEGDDLGYTSDDEAPDDRSTSQPGRGL